MVGHGWSGLEGSHERHGSREATPGGHREDGHYEQVALRESVRGVHGGEHLALAERVDGQTTMRWEHRERR